VALVQFSGDQKSALESPRIVSLDRQGDPLEKIHGFARVPVTLVNLWPSSDRNAMPVLLLLLLLSLLIFLLLLLGRRSSKK